MFKQLTTVMLAVSLNAQAAEFEGVYGYVGAGYKVDEFTWNDKPFGRNPTARFGIYGKWGKSQSRNRPPFTMARRGSFQRTARISQDGVVRGL